MGGGTGCKWFLRSFLLDDSKVEGLLVSEELTARPASPLLLLVAKVCRADLDSYYPFYEARTPICSVFRQHSAESAQPAGGRRFFMYSSSISSSSSSSRLSPSDPSSSSSLNTCSSMSSLIHGRTEAQANSFRKENGDPSRECCEAVSPFPSSSRLEIAIESRSAVTTGVVAGEEDGRRINSFTEPSP